MVVKRARHLVGDDKIYQENDAITTRVLDGSNNDLGSIYDYLFQGKQVEGVNVTDIKRTGIYKVKNLKGLPSDVSTSDTSILEVTSVGNQDKPEFIHYKVTTNNGVVKEMSVRGDGGNNTGWTLGGVQLQNTVSGLQNQIGDLKKLETSSKTSITNAVNIVKDMSDDNKKSIDSLRNDLNTYKGHNHDDRYVTKWGGEFTGDVNLKSGIKLNGHTWKGTLNNLISANSGKDWTDLNLGNDEMALRIKSRNGDVTINGSKVITVGNAGIGSGLDADKLDGIESASFMRKDIDNRVTSRYKGYGINSQIILSGIADSVMNKREQTGLLFRRSDSDETVVSAIRSNQNGELNFMTNASGIADNVNTKSTLKLLSNGITSTQGQYVTGRLNGNAFLEFRQEENKSGIGFQTDKGAGDVIDQLHVRVWAKGGQNIMTFGAGGNRETVQIYHSPYIGEHGARLFIQSEEPSGHIPEQSVWLGW